MHLNETGNLPLNKAKTELRADKNVSKPDTSFKGQETKNADSDDAKRVPVDVAKAYLGISETHAGQKENTKKTVVLTPEELNGKDKYGKDRFKDSEKTKLIECSKTCPNIRDLINLKNVDGNPIFNAQAILFLAEDYEKYPKEINELAFMKKPDGTPRFNMYGIKSLLPIMEDSTLKYIAKQLSNLNQIENNTKIPRFNGSEIVELSKMITDPNLKDTVISLMNLSEKDGEYDVPRFSGNNIIMLANKVSDNDKTAEIIKKLIDERIVNGGTNTPRFKTAGEIIQLADLLSDEDTGELAKELLNKGIKFENTNFPFLTASEITEFVKSKDKFKMNLSAIVDATTSNKIPTFKKRFSLNEINKLAKAATDEDSKELIVKLASLNKDTVRGKDIITERRFTIDEIIKLANAMKDKNKSKRIIDRINLYYKEYNQTTFCLTADEILNATDEQVKKIVKKDKLYEEFIDVSKLSFLDNEKLNRLKDVIKHELENGIPDKDAFVKLLKANSQNQDNVIAIINNENLYEKAYSAITELDKVFKGKANYYNLGGLIDIMINDPEKYQKIADSGIFDLINDGKLNPIVLRKLGVNSDLTPNMYKDLETVKSGKNIVPEFPEGTDLKTAFEKSETGDAVEVGNKMYINDGKQLTEWNMTKEKYLDLFPPVLRFATCQGSLGDCYLVQALGLSMDNPQARAKFLQSFHLDGDDVIVTIKGLGDYNPSREYKNGNIKLAENNKHVDGCKGLQMYEQAYAHLAMRSNAIKNLKSNQSKEINPVIEDTDKIMDRASSGTSAQAFSDIYGQGSYSDIKSDYYFEKYEKNETINDTKNHSYDSIIARELPILVKDFKTGKTSILYKDLSTLDLAKKIKVFDNYFKNFPNKSLCLSKFDLDTFKALVSHTANNKEFLISFGTPSQKNDAAESTLLPEYNLVSSHAYSIVGYDEKTEKAKIINPHSYAEVTEIPIDILYNNTTHIDFIKL